MEIFDTHTHLNVEEFAGREAEELQLAAEMGVSNMNVVGFDRPTIERALLWKPICWTSLVIQKWWLWARLGWTITG